MTAGEDPTAKAHRSDADEALLRLILEAFALAKQSGKEDWQLMYAGPLKNRMLLLTGGEQDIEWTATPFTSLLERFPDVLRIERGRKPPMVELLEPSRLESLPASSSILSDNRIAEQSGVDSSAHDVRRWRIRKDLWDAVLGVRASDAFVWQDGTVVRVPHDQTADHAGTELPTLTGPELDSWQGEFAHEQPPDDRYSRVLESWARGASPTSALPRHLQHLWYGRLKTLVRDRLQAWFIEHSIEVPEDLIEVEVRGSVHRAQSASALRRLVQSCVEVMTEDELRDLHLPPAAVLRLRR